MVVYENVLLARDSGTLEQLKELSSKRKVVKESINENNFITEAIAREMSRGLTSDCEQEFFDVNPRRYSKADYKLIVDGIEDTATRRYRQYKAKVNAYIRDKGIAVPYHGLMADVWEKCIERSSSKNI
ncbi:BRO1 domain-containing protein [Abeliophyllum distichum]|uniref:BRO1 domain-containing protein n=1 Tax=Abeliophyllum distichum TaxID=126358 RepID=A0ABD1RW43_9LAMI